ncbi:hypothetical protein [Psychromarinibacter halotolerans]|uniref:Uncharacterized protein n=1 Tax=Psychromarinibacter halotolerans TaxID=1775175 RepID=A0ABV7GVK4_9RHOB|nr:hypothetical protein [Psychromarinibacter halotolerans]MDF0596887.1 hypothetical protein [Psychromarinibacter halotolerans]
MNLRRANQLLNALVLFAVMFFASAPDATLAHEDDHTPADAAVLHDLHNASSRSAGKEPAGHCHPGLDCFTAAVFVLSVDITTSVVVTTAKYHTPFQIVEDVCLEAVLPPPRLLF